MNGSDRQDADNADEMIERQLRNRGVQDRRVLDAMRAVPRELFVPTEQSAAAYADRALPIECGQTISQPLIVAMMTEALRVAPQHRILEVGTGSGYQTAVLARLARHVYTIERHEALSHIARERLTKIGVTSVSFAVGDGTLGWPEAAPFDGIIVTAAAPDVPDALKQQLADNGRIVIPVGSRNDQHLITLERRGNRWREEQSIPCRFVKLIGQDGWSDDEAE